MVVQEQTDAQPDAVVGYRELGISESEGAAEYLDEGQGRINRLKVFYPCNTYSAEVMLNPITATRISSLLSELRCGERLPENTG